VRAHEQHLRLGSRDAVRSGRWYQGVRGFRSLANQTTGQWKRTLFDHADGAVVLVLHQHLSAEAVDFDERRTGLDHLAFRVPDYDALLAWQERLESLGVSCSHIADAPPRGGKVLTFRDPDGIALELFHRPPDP
jgi:glyoxylase I family protein